MKAVIRHRRHLPRLLMDKKNLWFWIIMALIVAISEVHTFWERSTITGKWIYVYPWATPLSLQQYVYQNSQMVNWVLFSIYAWKLGKHPSRIGFWLLGLFIVWKCVNIPFWWYNYRTFGYGWVYFGLVILGVITYHWNPIRRRLRKWTNFVPKK